MKRAGVVCRPAGVVVHAYSCTTQGVWVTSEPYEVFDANTAVGELADGLRRVLSKSREEVPHPTDWGKTLKPLLRAGAARSWRDFVRGATSVIAEEEAGTIELVPTRNLGPREGFDLLEDKLIRVKATDSLERPLETALKRSS